MRKKRSQERPSASVARSRRVRSSRGGATSGSSLSISVLDVTFPISIRRGRKAPDHVDRTCQLTRACRVRDEQRIAARECRGPALCVEPALTVERDEDREFLLERDGRDRAESLRPEEAVRRAREERVC